MRWKLHNPEFDSDKLNPGLSVSPWSGHRHFAYDLVSALQPKRIVELGSHYGCSLFAFAQAIKDGNLPTELFGVDTWEGDEHAGFYSDEVFQLVCRTRIEQFKGISLEFLRKTFLEARADFEDESIDILHIDGLHTYEAVVEDFETWLCKLAPEGVVLLHDVNPKLTYGSRKHWEEVSIRFPSLGFDHSWGLGVLFPKGASKRDLIAGELWEERRLVYEFGAQARFMQQQTRDMTCLIDEHRKALDRMQLAIQSRDEAIVSQTQLIDARDTAISKQKEMIEERDLAIAAQKIMIDERDSAIAVQKTMIDERDSAIAAQKIMIDERDSAIAAQKIMIDERDSAIAAQKIMIDERDSAIAAQARMIDDRKVAMDGMEYMIKERDSYIKELETRLAR